MDPVRVDTPSCPFCAFCVPSSNETDMYSLMHHLELSHPEGGISPFKVVDERRTPSRNASLHAERAARSRTPSDHGEEEEVYVECPLQCGEAVTLDELSSHMELHGAEGAAFDDPNGPRSREASPLPGGRRSTSTGPSRHLDVPQDSSEAYNPSSGNTHRSHSAHKRSRDNYGLKDWKDLFLGPASRKTRATNIKARSTAVKRLGKSELGPHAFEAQMPTWLRKQLEHGARVTVVNQLAPNGQIIRVETVANETPGIVPVLAQLCEQDPALSKVFLCHPGVKHVVKMAKEGGFCGYRNIQMMVSFIQATGFLGCEHFPGRTPSILLLQDMIERAWDQGINSSGRIETGGIRGTRKYIGTPEAQALLCSLNIPCEANAFNNVGDGGPVYQSVLQAVLEYFSIGVTDPSHKVYQTSLPPIYLQHPGHSLTIVGLEVRKSGSMNVLVLDPMFKTSPGICRLIGAKFRARSPQNLLKAYRRGSSYLQKYSSFEVLKLVVSPPRAPARPMIEARYSDLSASSAYNI
ncbi:hypothetical protein MMC32_007712 [Xylographa parallela]|nr:hypothetical protein [Xylographa parallela]